MLKFEANMDAVAEAIGTVYGIDEETKSADYLDRLAKDAHNDASIEFDMAVAATAGAGYLTHVFEYGVPGITPGPSTFSDPIAENARLYAHWFRGTRGHYDVDYVFRPATRPNPTNTTKTTGVRSKYLSKLSKRKYIFFNRAWVMEMGQDVEIAPLRSNFLFIPSDQDPRGFIMWNAKLKGPIHATPGRETKGTFTAFFENWWSSQGIARMDRDIQNNITTDITRVMDAAEARAARYALEPVSAKGYKHTVARAKGQTKAHFSRIIATRGRTNRK